MVKKALLTFTGTFLVTMLVTAQVVFSSSLDIRGASGASLPELGVVVLEQTLAGEAGASKPAATGQLDGAGVVGYVFPTTLSPSEAGFGNAEGILAVAVTSHTDFDDTPMFDENSDGDYANDGELWHSHWVVLTDDDRVSGGLSVQQFEEGDSSVVMPPTNPGLPIYLDSPGFPVVVQGNSVKVLVPRGVSEGFTFDAVSAYMEVNTSDETQPLLGVQEVYSVLSGDLSLPYEVQRKQ